MNNESNAITSIINKVTDAINGKISNLSYDKTFPTVSYGKDENGKYKIVYEGRLRSVQNALPCEIATGSLVWVKIPCGKLREMHICGLRRK